MSRLLSTALTSCALLMTSTAAVDLNADAYGTLAQQQEQELQGRRHDDHHHGHDKCRGKHREWGAFHACDCRRGSASFEKSYRDCLDVSTNPPTILPIIDFKPCECPRKHGILSEEDGAAEADEAGDVDAAGRDDRHKPKPVPKPHKCYGHKDGFRFEWGAPHFCEPKDHKRCKVGEEGTTYEDCLAKDKHGNVFQTGLTRDVKCKIERCPDHGHKQVEVPTPKKCYGEEDGFRFEWGAPHACDPKDPKRCKIGQEGTTYRDCLAIKKKTGEMFITALNEQVKCKVERCDKKPHKPHKPHKLYAEEDDEEEVAEADNAAVGNSDDVEAADVEAEFHIPRPDKCYGKKDGFRFKWGAPHACDPKDPKRCKVGEKGTTYQDCLAVDKYGREFQTGLVRDVKCKVERCDKGKKQVDVPTPKKCYGEEDGFRFEWGAPHACDPKDPKRCRVGQEGVTYRDCLAIKKKTGEKFITALNEQVKCKVERCDKDKKSSWLASLANLIFDN